MLADFYKDKGHARKSGFPVTEIAPAKSGIAEGVCRSCGARKTLRDGRSVECDYCGSVISAT